jgi:2Fe-2S ferredoxin
MPQIIVLPHASLCPDGATFKAGRGTSTCHIIVREGFASLKHSTEMEDDMLDKAWGLEPQSRLACQTYVNNADLVIEIPMYSINMVKEGH